MRARPFVFSSRGGAVSARRGAAKTGLLCSTPPASVKDVSLSTAPPPRALERIEHRIKARSREYILWIEGIGFSLIIALIWSAEFLQMPHLLFSEPPTFLLGRALVRSLVILSVWAAVHLATRRLLKRLHQLEEYLLVCAWCRKIGHEGEWMTTEKYFGSAFSTLTTHGICPECSRTVKKSLACESANGARS
jgi:hypothetical protein